MGYCATVVAILLAACIPHPARSITSEIEDVTRFWCVSATATTGETLLACAERRETCTHMRREAMAWGSTAGIESVGRCQWGEWEP